MEIVVFLPADVFEKQLSELLLTLGQANVATKVILDFKNVRYLIPGGVVLLMAKVRGWLSQGQRVAFRNHRNCKAFRYLQRINFFKSLGLDFPENFKRHEKSPNFMPVQTISSKLLDVGPMASRLASCVVPNARDREVRLLLEYAAGEAIANSKQHSGSRGFASSQYSPSVDFARMAVADSGKGILGSFKDNCSPHYFEGMTDRDAIEKALQPRVSSTTHIPRGPYSPGSPNFGVGLSMMHNLVEESLGFMFLASGNCWYYKDGRREGHFGTVLDSHALMGTICAVTFQRGQIDNFQRMICEARRGIGLQAESVPANLFIV